VFEEAGTRGKRGGGGKEKRRRGYRLDKLKRGCPGPSMGMEGKKSQFGGALVRKEGGRRVAG